jgi:hypothetical protein
VSDTKQPVDADKQTGSPRSHWNYRVIERELDGETWRGIHEVYYRDGEPKSYTAEAVDVSWLVADEVDGATVLDRMREALGKPVLTSADFPAGPTNTSRP